MDPMAPAKPQFHSGDDYAAAPGTPIPAATPGEVVYSGFNDNFGNTVIVKNPAGYSLYAHMQDGSPMPKPGQRVWPGDILGHVGSTGARTTGPHLHYSVIKNDVGIVNKASGGSIGARLTKDNTIDPSAFDTSVRHTDSTLPTGGRPAGTVALEDRLHGGQRGGVFSERFGAWGGSDDGISAPMVATSRPGGLVGMIADYLRQNQSPGREAPTPNGAVTVPAVPFVQTTDPLSQSQSASFDSRFGDWTRIRRLTSSRDAAR